MPDKAIEIEQHYLKTVLARFYNLKHDGDRAIDQIQNDEEIHLAHNGANSLAVIVKHLRGNMRSRWVDLFITDGEKPDRNRDDEFVDDVPSMVALRALWEEGWSYLFTALESLGPDDVLRILRIRGEELTVMSAIERQLVHIAGHVGQIVYLVKSLRGMEFKTLSIPRGGSKEFNEGFFALVCQPSAVSSED